MCGFPGFSGFRSAALAAGVLGIALAGLDLYLGSISPVRTIMMMASTAGLVALALRGGTAGVALTSRAGGNDPSPVSAPARSEVDEVAELTRQRDAAEQANLAKSRYLANVSHEIRSPLNAIYGYAQLVERGADIDPRNAARVIRRSAEHLTNLVEGLLDIASVEQGVVRIDNGVVRLDALVEQVAEMFAPLAEQKGLVFRLDLPDRMPEFVRMDERRVRQALINLVSNAVKFTERGEIGLQLRWSGQTATFVVSDTGPGIAPELQQAIFSPFQRGSDAGEERSRGVTPTTPAPGSSSGAGLGLAITIAIARMLGGDLSLQSSPGQGSRFSLTLMAPPVSGLVERSAERLRPIGYAGPRRAILLVDDDRDHLAVLRMTLGEIGFAVTEASDGPAALALAEQGRFDAVICDVSMPGMTGWEVAAALRARKGRDLKILMLSANAFERHGVAGREADHDAFLIKPIELSALIDAIGRQLGLEWQYPAEADDSANSGASGRSASPQEAAAGRSAKVRAHVERIKSLVQIGHVRALEGEIRELEQAEPSADELAARLYACLDRFDLAAIKRIVEEF